MWWSTRDFNCLLCYLASQRADHLVGTGAAGIEWRAVERGAASARWEQEVAQAEALALPGERLPTAPPPALSSTAAAVAAYAEAITDGIQDELRASAVRRDLGAAAEPEQRVRRTPGGYRHHLAGPPRSTSTWPAPTCPFRCCTTPTRFRIVRRSGGTVTLDGGPLTSTGYRRCRTGRSSGWRCRGRSPRR